MSFDGVREPDERRGAFRYEGTAVALYFLRMFAVTAIHHRYFSHKTYSTSRPVQFLLAVWAGTTVSFTPRSASMRRILRLTPKS